MKNVKSSNRVTESSSVNTKSFGLSDRGYLSQRQVIGHGDRE